jgi:hypothetical protein
MDDLPKKCDRCGWDREGCQFIYSHRLSKKTEKSELVETVCDDCYMEELKLDYRKEGRLSTKLVMHAVMQREVVRKGWRLGQTLDAVVQDRDTIQDIIDVFFLKVWQDGLRELYLKDEARGMKAKVGGTEVLLYCLAGRVSVQLQQQDGQYVHLLTTDEEKVRPLGVQGLSCTVHAARAMFAEAEHGWASGRLKPERDDDVGIGL